MHQEKAQQEKLKAVKAHLNFKEASQYSESETPNRRRNLKERLGPRLGDKEKNVSAHSRGLERKSYYSSRRDTESFYQSSRSKETETAFEKHHHKREYSRRTEAVSESSRQNGTLGNANLVPYVQFYTYRKCQEKMHQRSGRNLQHQAKKRASMKEFVRRYKLECRDVKGAPECMKISGFMHGITNPELIKRLHDKIPKSMDEMMREEDRTKGPMIIEAEMGGHCVHRIYVDKGSSSEILYEHCFSKFRLEIKTQLIPANTPLVGFNREIIWPLGQISLLVKIGDKEHSTTAWMNFMVVRSPSPYNGIIGRPGVRKIRAIPSTIHGMIKFPMAGEIVTLQSSSIIPLECSMVLEPGVPRSAVNLVREEKIQVAIHSEYLKQTVAIGSTLTEEGRKELCRLLRRHLDVFAWKPANMTRVPQHMAEHRLNVREGCLTIRQKKRGQAPERNNAISEEVKKLVEADIMKEVHYHSWLSNPVMKCTKKSDFQWTPEAEGAFKEMKQSIAELSMLTEPKENEELNMYLAALKEAISAILMTERDGKQVPVYFVSRALQGPEINYIPMEKLILALVSASKRLKRYLQTHTIVVITDQPIKQLLSNPKVTGRLLKWIFKLGEHDIQYRPRTSVKGQILADFIMEHPEDDAPDTPIEDREELPDPWILFTDGSSCIDGSGAVLIITNPEGMEFTYAIRFRFNATNNEAEYEALIASLRIARQIGVQNLQTNVDSKLVANQEKAIDEKEIIAVVEEEGHTWMTPVYEYLTEGILPEEKKKARTVRRKAGRYAMINEVLHKKSFIGPWLRCVGPLQANYVLREIHKGSCSMHAGPRSVVAKALRSGYSWPTMHTDARNLIRECKDCQGINIAGPFSEGPGKVKFLIVAMDYFTKWIEARPVATITGTRVKRFVWDNIVCRFGLPGEIVSDNGKQFRDNLFKDWKQGAKPEWKDITTPGFEAPAFVQETLSTGATKQAMRKTEASLNLSARDHTKSRKHWANEHTGLETGK
nr:reverse transcriptase domain-containing protein [Tanacetum cinerariifolium]